MSLGDIKAFFNLRIAQIKNIIIRSLYELHFGKLTTQLSLWITNTSLAAKGALTHRLQRCTAYKIQNGRQGAPKWPTGSGKVSTLKFLAF